MTDDRLADLESRFAFQEDTIERLNEIVVRQQRQIDGLVAALDELGRQLRNLQQSQVAELSQETPPPHY